MGKTGIIYIYSTHIQVEMDNPYPTQIQRIWIWVRVVGIQWQVDTGLPSKSAVWQHGAKKAMETRKSSASSINDEVRGETWLLRVLCIRTQANPGFQINLKT